jgi:hypothetical protein
VIVTKTILKILKAKNSRFKYLVGKDAKTIFILTRFLPDFIKVLFNFKIYIGNVCPIQGY